MLLQSTWGWRLHVNVHVLHPKTPHKTPRRPRAFGGLAAGGPSAYTKLKSGPVKLPNQFVVSAPGGGHRRVFLSSVLPAPPYRRGCIDAPTPPSSPSRGGVMDSAENDMARKLGPVRRRAQTTFTPAQHPRSTRSTSSTLASTCRASCVLRPPFIRRLSSDLFLLRPSFARPHSLWERHAASETTWFHLPS